LCIMSEQEQLVEMIDPDGNRKFLPPGAAKSHNVIALGFKPVVNMDRALRHIIQPVPAEVLDTVDPVVDATVGTEDVTDSETPKRGRPRKA